MIRMNVNRILPLMLLLVLFASCSRKYKVEGVSSVTSLDGKMLYLKTLRDGQWIAIDSAEVVHGLFSTSGPSDEQLTQEGEALVKEMNDYIKEFISTNYENVLGPSVFMMMCSTLPYPIMTPQIEDIIRTAPQTFKSSPLVREFLDKAKENMKLIEEHRRMEESGKINN